MIFLFRLILSIILNHYILIFWVPTVKFSQKRPNNLDSFPKILFLFPKYWWIVPNIVVVITPLLCSTDYLKHFDKQILSIQFWCKFYNKDYTFMFINLNYDGVEFPQEDCFRLLYLKAIKQSSIFGRFIEFL